MKYYKGHDLNTILNDIKNKGYEEQYVLYIINFFKNENIKKYFNKHNLKFKQENNLYIFTYQVPPNQKTSQLYNICTKLIMSHST